MKRKARQHFVPLSCPGQLCSLKEHYGAEGKVKGERDCGSRAVEASSNWYRGFPISTGNKEDN